MAPILLLPSPERIALAAALAIGLLVVGAMLIGDVLDRLQRLRR
jgi:hypothetical protein